MTDFLAEMQRARDWRGLILFVVLLAIAGWLCLMPFLPVIQRSTINRFHLATSHFAAWVLQQPVPPMYNLENRFWFSRRPLTPDELTEAPPAGVETGMLNHFPTRTVTFADGRAIRLLEGRGGWLYVRSRYQSSERVTGFEISAAEDGVTMVMRRIEVLP